MPATAKTNWFWSDWSGDQAVRRLTPAERGVWIDLLALAAVGNPKGYVCDAKRKPVALEEIARFTNCPDLGQLAALIDAIVAKGAASRDRRGRLFSRRMVRDAKLAAIRSENGKKGIDAKLGKEKQKPILLKQSGKQNPERLGASSDDSPLKQEGETSGSAEPRAREAQISDHVTSSPVIAPTASALAARLGDTIGFAESDPRRTGLAYAAQRWLAGGWDADLILATVAQVAARAPRKPAAYYEPAIAEAHARLEKPLPLVVFDQPTTLRVTRPGDTHASQDRSLVAASRRLAERVATALAASADGIVNAEPGTTGDRDPAGAPLLRLVSQIRGG